MDCRILAANTILAQTHSDKIWFDDPRVKLAILRATGIVDMKLGRKFSGVSTMEVTPYVSPALKPQADEEGEGENTSTCELLGVTAASSATTEMWTVTFSSTTAFSVTGSLSKSQGSGTIGTAFVSTNADISIATDAFSGTPVTSDKIYFMTYKHHKSIVCLASMLAVGLISKGQQMQGPVNENDPGIQMYNDAINLLDDIVEDKAGLIGVNYLPDTKDIMQSYEIDVFGYDISNYGTDTYSRFAGDSTNSNNWPFWFAK